MYLLPVHWMLTYISHKQGSDFYNKRIQEGKTTPKIFDIGIKYTPNLSGNPLLSVWSNFIMLLLPLFFGSDVAFEHMKYFSFIVIIRYLFNNLTILPKEKHCDDTSFNAWNLIFGHCYDKVFSGHFASLFLLTLILIKRGILTNMTVAVLLNVFNAWVILALRYHYSVDIAVAIVVVLLVYKSIEM